MDLSKKTLPELREIAKAKGIKRTTGIRKQDLVLKITEAMQQEEKDARRSKGSGTAKVSRKTVERAPKKMEEGSAEEKPAEEKSAEEKPAGEKTVERVPGRPAGRSSERRPGHWQGRSMGNRREPVTGRRMENTVSQKERITETRAERKSERGEEFQAEQRPDRTAQTTNYYYHANQPQRYHDGTDGLISIMKERQVVDVHPTELKELDSGVTKNGILEIMPEGYGFIRCDNFLPGENDVYVAPQFIRRFGLRTGDVIEGNLRIRTQNEKFSALLYMKKVNDRTPAYLYQRKKFEELTPVFPNQRIHLETPDAGVSMRMLDLISPIGKGQRGMIVSQPKTGKTTLLKQVARAVTKNYPKMNLIILLIDERPEEVTDIKESIEGERVEVIYSTFDELPENHKRVSEMVIERAKRLVESGEDVMILLDSITRLARAYNLTVTPSGRTLSGGLDPAALHMPKRFFGAARNMREGGSLTVLATALVDTGSRMDDVVFEEFKGTGNMELVLDRSLSEKRIFPAIDIQKSSTRREDLLLNQEEQEAVVKIRKALSGMKSDQALEQILNLFVRTKNNVEFIETVKKMHL
ncbi:MAG: transcription termination factor Rho [Lachnospiraceae bacterium]|nr:transcription termination factor Rho [Lachnospiraceae bacterium]